MSKDELIERLAAIEHERWAHWQAYLHSRGMREPGTRKLILDYDWIERWERQIATAYADLSEREKQSDREQVMRYWPHIVEFVAEWIEEQDWSCGENAATMARFWREEMRQGWWGKRAS